MKHDENVKWEQLYTPLFGHYYSEKHEENIYVQCRFWRIVDGELQYKTANGHTYVAMNLHFPRKETK